MPQDSEHRQQARENRDFAEYLLRTNPTDVASMQWAVTAAFYCAVHCIEAHFSAYNVHSSNHLQRETRMAQPRYAIPSDIYAAYMQLKQWSMQGRYRLRHFNSVMVR